MFSKCLLTAILLFTMISSITASGHLRLDITPSNDCALRLITNVLHAESFWMTMGEMRTTSFHPLIEQDSIKVSFSVDGMPSQERVYEIKKSGKSKRTVLVFDQMVILVEATVECDQGFTGSRCQRPINNGSMKPRSTTTSSTTTTSTPTTSTAVTTKEVPTPSALLQMENNSIVIMSLVVIVLALLALILTVCFISRRRHSIYIEPVLSCESIEIKKTDASLDSGFSTKTTRYTAEPHLSIVITP